MRPWWRIVAAVLVVAALGLTFVTVRRVARSARVSPSHPTEVVQIYETGDFTEGRFWPPGLPAVQLVTGPDERDAGSALSGPFHPPYPYVIDRRADRLNGLASAAEAVPAWQPIPSPSRASRMASAPGSLDPVTWTDKILLVATPAVHAEYAQLLAALRAPVGAAFLTVVAGESAPPESPGVQDAEAKLAEVLPEVSLDSVTLQAAIDQIAASARANILVDWTALESAGIERSPTIKLKLWDLPLSRVLSAVLASFGNEDVPLGFRAGDGVIRVTTQEALRTSGRTMRIYDVRPLIDGWIASDGKFRRNVVPPKGHFGGQGNPNQGRAVQDADNHAGYVDEVVEELAALVKETVDEDSWRDNGGSEGAIREWGGRLMITHSPEGHREIEALLAKLSKEFTQDAEPSTAPIDRSP